MFIARALWLSTFLFAFLTKSSFSHDLDLKTLRYSTWSNGSSASACLEKAAQISTRLRSELGLEIVSANCGDPIETEATDGEQIYLPISIFYRSNEKLSLYSVELGRSASSSSQEGTGSLYGAFSSFKACSAARPQLESQFGRYTGLSILSSYCMKAHSTLGSLSSSYFLQIDGFSSKFKSPEQELYVFSPSYAASIFDNYTELESDLVTRIEGLGGSVVHSSNGSVWYFSRKRLHITQWGVETYANRAECEAQRRHVLFALGRVEKQTYPQVYCLGFSVSPDSVHKLMAIWNGAHHIRDDFSSLFSYSSLQECLADLNRLNQEAYSTALSNYFPKRLGYYCGRGLTTLDPRKRFLAKSIEWQW